MATKRINFATINATTISTMSKYNVAHYELKALREEYKAECVKIQNDKAKILENRKHDIDCGLSGDEVTRKWSLEGIISRQNSLDEKYEKDCKPHKDSQKECLKFIDENLYFGYILAQSGSLEKKGSIVVKKGKDKSETIELEKSYKDMIKDFAISIGCSKTDDDKAINKFATTMSIRTSGMVQCSKGDDYVKVKSASQYNRLFMLNFLQYLVREVGILVEDENHNLSMKKFDEEVASATSEPTEEVKEEVTEVKVEDMVEDSKDYSTMSYRELQAECKAKGIKASGKVEELIARLMA